MSVPALATSPSIFDSANADHINTRPSLKEDGHYQHRGEKASKFYMLKDLREPSPEEIRLKSALKYARAITHKRIESLKLGTSVSSGSSNASPSSISTLTTQSTQSTQSTTSTDFTRSTSTARSAYTTEATQSTVDQSRIERLEARLDDLDMLEPFLKAHDYTFIGFKGWAKGNLFRCEKHQGHSQFESIIVENKEGERIELPFESRYGRSTKGEIDLVQSKVQHEDHFHSKWSPAELKSAILNNIRWEIGEDQEGCKCCMAGMDFDEFAPAIKELARAGGGGNEGSLVGAPELADPIHWATLLGIAAPFGLIGLAAANRNIKGAHDTIEQLNIIIDGVTEDIERCKEAQYEGYEWDIKKLKAFSRCLKYSKVDSQFNLWIPGRVNRWASSLVLGTALAKHPFALPAIALYATGQMGRNLYDTARVADHGIKYEENDTLEEQEGKDKINDIFWERLAFHACSTAAFALFGFGAMVTFLSLPAIGVLGAGLLTLPVGLGCLLGGAAITGYMNNKWPRKYKPRNGDLGLDRIKVRSAKELLSELAWRRRRKKVLKGAFKDFKPESNWKTQAYWSKKFLKIGTALPELKDFELRTPLNNIKKGLLIADKYTFHFTTRLFGFAQQKTPESIHNHLSNLWSGTKTVSNYTYNGLVKFGNRVYEGVAYIGRPISRVIAPPLVKAYSYLPAWLRFIIPTELYFGSQASSRKHELNLELVRELHESKEQSDQLQIARIAVLEQLISPPDASSYQPNLKQRIGNLGKIFSASDHQRREKVDLSISSDIGKLNDKQRFMKTWRLLQELNLGKEVVSTWLNEGLYHPDQAEATHEGGCCNHDDHAHNHSHDNNNAHESSHNPVESCEDNHCHTHDHGHEHNHHHGHDHAHGHDHSHENGHHHEENHSHGSHQEHEHGHQHDHDHRDSSINNNKNPKEKPTSSSRKPLVTKPGLVKKSGSWSSFSAERFWQQSTDEQKQLFNSAIDYFLFYNHTKTMTYQTYGIYDYFQQLRDRPRNLINRLLLR